MKLTDKQQQLMNLLRSHPEGTKISIETSQYDNDAGWVGDYFSHPSIIRGLAKRGLIKIESAFWRGYIISTTGADR